MSAAMDLTSDRGKGNNCVGDDDSVQTTHVWVQLVSPHHEHAIYRRSNHMTCRLHRLWPWLDPICNRFALVSITFKAAGSTKLVVAPILELHVSPLASWRGP